MNFQTAQPALQRHDSCVEHASKSHERTRLILVADDDAQMRRLISLVLTTAGFDVRTVSDGEQAWEAVCREPYDLLVTDNDMPHLSGLNLIQRIRDAGLHLPIIIASGTLSAESAHDHPQLQIASVLTKPFSIPELLDAVNALSLLACGDAATRPAAGSRLYANLQPTR
jgi:CheY-like chemotaxis protein